MTTRLARGLVRRLRLAGPWLTMAAAGFVSACFEPDSTPDAESGPIISDPVSSVTVSAAGAGFAAARGAAEVEVAYVSLPPGTIPDGEVAVIRDRRSGTAVTTAMLDGGFDPVAVTASVGDTLDVDVRVSGGDVPRHLVLAVPAYRKPRVVRTYPPHKKRDVVLNVMPLVIFSEPIDQSTLSEESVQLWRVIGGIRVRVPGQRDFRDAEHLSAGFMPAAQLDANADYELVVTTGIRDLDGDALETATRARFRTGSSVAQPAALIIAPNPLLSVTSDYWGWGTSRFPLHATLLDATGNEVPYTGEVLWRSSDSTVVSMGLGGAESHVGGSDEYARIGYVPGEATIMATAGGVTATASVVIRDVPFDVVSVGVNNLTCYLDDRGAAYCTGSNHLGQLGIGAGTQYHAEIPVGVAGGLSFKAISPGIDHTCALTSEGAAYCWGENGYGQLGDGTGAPLRAAPVPVASGLTFTQIGSGWDYACALSTAGQAFCWGNYGSWTAAGSAGSVPTPVPGDLTFTRLGVAGGHACGLDSGGAAYCWGGNQDGQLGDGSLTTSYSPVAVTGGHRFVAIAGGNSHTCGVTTAGEAYCWGRAGLEPDSHVNSEPQVTPARVSLPEGVALVDITVGQMTSCGLTADGTAYCWGWAYPCSECVEVEVPPRQIPGLRFKSLDAGPPDRVCGVTSDSKVQCWTSKYFLQLPASREGS